MGPTLKTSKPTVRTEHATHNQRSLAKSLEQKILQPVKAGNLSIREYKGYYLISSYELVIAAVDPIKNKAFLLEGKGPSVTTSKHRGLINAALNHSFKSIEFEHQGHGSYSTDVDQLVEHLDPL